MAYHKHSIEDKIIPQRLETLVDHSEVPRVCILLMEWQQGKHDNEAIPVGCFPPHLEKFWVIALRKACD